MASSACRRLTASAAPRQSLELQLEQSESPLTRGEVARTLNELCERGLLEKFKDEFNITRYRPTDGRVV